MNYRKTIRSLHSDTYFISTVETTGAWIFGQIISIECLKLYTFRLTIYFNFILNLVVTFIWNTGYNIYTYLF